MNARRIASWRENIKSGYHKQLLLCVYRICMVAALSEFNQLSRKHCTLRHSQISHHLSQVNKFHRFNLRPKQSPNHLVSALSNPRPAYNSGTKS